MEMIGYGSIHIDTEGDVVQAIQAGKFTITPSQPSTNVLSCYQGFLQANFRKTAPTLEERFTIWSKRGWRR